ncbi:MAG: PepSY-associated TM helix domain-containing protein [Bdellovibrionales bacterium]|nr:PepSY-associated TM helix domain-containing protein [Massilia sp.]
MTQASPVARQGASIPHAMPAAEARSQRAVVLKWLRKTHGWIGLWGAILGLLFGTTGILLNHRTVLKIPAAQAQESSIQMALPQTAPADPKAMAAWLSSSLGIAREASRVKADPAKPVAWGDKSLTQPARWSGAFTGPQSGVQFEYWVGNNFVTVKRNDNNGFATLSNLHKGTGMGIGWILLVDTLAGSIILLSITGVLLWALMTRKRMVGTAIATASILTTFALAWQSM